MTRSSAFAICLALAAFEIGAPVRGGEPSESDGRAYRPNGPGRGHELHLFDVSSLTVGFHDFAGESSPRAAVVGAESERVGFDASPRFGSEQPERVPPFGTADEVADFVKLGHKAAFGEQGVELTAMGGSHLVFLGPRPLAESIAESIAATLAELERGATRFVAVDVLALRGDASRVVDGDLVAAIARGDLVPLTGARVVGASSLVATFVGGYSAFVAAENAPVVWGAKSFDPVIGVSRDGLSVEARVGGVHDDRVRVRLSISWAHPQAPVRREVGATNDPVETIETETRAFDADVDLAPGSWRLLPPSGDFAFAARVSVTLPPSRRPLGDALAIGAPIPEAGAVAVRSHSVHDLGAQSLNQRGFEPGLTPSGFQYPDPPELSEPRPAYPSDSLLDTIRVGVDSASWSIEGRGVELRNGTLYVKADEAHDRAVAALLDRLRRVFLRSTRLRVTDVTLPLASIPEYLVGWGDGTGVLANGLRGLLVRPGARVTGKAALTLRDGQRLASLGGTQHSYIADFDPEIMEGSNIGNPIIRNAFEGAVFDAHVVPSIDGSEALVAHRWTKARWRGSRPLPTSMGEIECPSLGIHRLGGAIAVPYGGSRVIGVALEGGDVTLTVLEASETNATRN